jgi:hypothetical protein
VTAPTPERRVGEWLTMTDEQAEDAENCFDQSRKCSGVIEDEDGDRSGCLANATAAIWRDEATAQRAAVVRLTAEVERLRGVASAALAVKESGLRLPVALLDTPAKAEAWLSFGKTLAALSLPTHAPGATE